MSPEQALQAARESFRRDLAGLSFDGYLISGPAKLVCIDTAKAELMVRRTPLSPKPFCYINLPTKGGPKSTDALSQALMHPKLRGCGADILDDITASLWAYVNLRLLEHPISADAIVPSQEVADMIWPAKDTNFKVLFHWGLPQRPKLIDCLRISKIPSGAGERTPCQKSTKFSGATLTNKLRSRWMCALLLHKSEETLSTHS
jgi:hypothetical protein